MRKLNHAIGKLAATLSLLVFAGLASAQTAWPVKPVRLVIPYAQGGSTGVLAQLVAARLGEAWGQQVLVDARAGGNTVIGTDYVAKSAPDGYTLLLTSNSHVVIPQLVATSFDALKDFAPIAAISSTELLLTLNPGVEGDTLQQFIALAKARPGSINYASAGNSSATHLAGELLANLAGIRMQHVPYKGSGPAVTDLLGGQVQAAFLPPIVAIPSVKSGKLKALAVSGETRVGALPQVPTFAQAGLNGLAATTWFGIVAPAGVQRPIIEKVEQDLRRMVAAADFKDKLASLGMDPFYLGASPFEELMKTDMARSARLIKASGIKLD